MKYYVGQNAEATVDRLWAAYSPTSDIGDDDADSKNTKLTSPDTSR
jgi:hypothetical protein